MYSSPCLLSAVVGTWGLFGFRLLVDNVSLALIQARDLMLLHVLTHAYAGARFTTPFVAVSLLTSVAAIVVYRYPPMRPLTPAPALSVVRVAAHTGAGAGAKRISRRRQALRPAHRG